MRRHRLLPDRIRAVLPAGHALPKCGRVLPDSLLPAWLHLLRRQLLPIVRPAMLGSPPRWPTFADARCALRIRSRIRTWVASVLRGADLHDQLDRPTAFPMMRLSQTVIHSVPVGTLIACAAVMDLALPTGLLEWPHTP